MVATAEIGRGAAKLLPESWTGRRVVELERPRRVTPNEVANIRDALKQPCQRDLHRSRLERCRRIERPRLQRRESSQREVGHISNALSRQIIDEPVIAALYRF